MANTWKKLDTKFKVRRIALVLAVAVLLIAMGWLLGNGISKKNSASAPDPVAILGESGAEEKAVDKPELMERELRAAPPEPEETSAVEDDQWMLILVNQDSPLEEDYQVELERVSGPHKLDSRIVVPFKQMVAQAKSDGINLELVSAYRSVDWQKQQYAQGLEERLEKGMTPDEARKDADLWICQPGVSEHHTGLAVDIIAPGYTTEDTDFDTSAAYRWLEEHAEEYGFVQRYPQGKEEITQMTYEPWHLRYVGPDAAKDMNENGYCLEEYIYLKDRRQKEDTKEFRLHPDEEEPEEDVSPVDEPELSTETPAPSYTPPVQPDPAPSAPSAPTVPEASSAQGTPEYGDSGELLDS